MISAQDYVLFGAPLLMLAVGLTVVGITHFLNARSGG
jgi:uncharacterized membrane protein